MKSKGKIFKKISKKIAGFTVAMLILQPMLMVAVAPATASAAIPVHVLGIAEHVVISEVQIEGYTVNDEFVELYNPTAESINLTGYRLSKINNNGVEKTLNASLSGVIPSNGYFLVTPQVGYTGSTVADDVYSQTSVYLAANNAVKLYSDAGTTLVDMVGYGTDLDIQFETAAFAENPAAGQSLERKASVDSTALTMAIGGIDHGKGNAWDADNNFSDFVLKTASEPQNSDSDIEDIIAPNKPTVTVPDFINTANETAVPVTIEGEIDATYNFRITEQGALGAEILQTGNLEGSGNAILSVDVSTLLDGDLIVGASQVDESGNEGSENVSTITKDTIAPIASLEATPILGNSATKKIKLTVSSDEQWGGLVEKNGKVYNGLDEVGGGVIFSTTPMTTFEYSGEFDLSWLTEDDKNVDLIAKTVVIDVAGNPTNISVIFRIDDIAPGKVTDLKVVAGNGKVDLSWKNPTDSDLANIQIVRNGTVLATLASTVTAYSDTAVVNGANYTYDVYAVDTAGNKSDKVSASATPSAPQAISAASTSRVASAITTETLTPPIGEVKAAEITKDDDQGQADEKGTEVKETKRIPVWGIIFLLILAAIGGYLFYVQNPENSKK